MFEGYQYSYLILDLLLLAVWLGLYWARRDVRREMLALSFPLGVIGLLLTLPNANDWWLPQTITGQLPSIEDFLFGFTTGGIASVIYVELFRKHVQRKRAREAVYALEAARLWQLVAVFSGMFFVLHYGFALHSILISVIFLGLGIIALLAARPDLWRDAFWSGLLMIGVAAVIYELTDWLTPGWVGALWIYDTFSGVSAFGLPLEEIMFYGLFGAAFGPYYEAVTRAQLVEVTNE